MGKLLQTKEDLLNKQTQGPQFNGEDDCPLSLSDGSGANHYTNSQMLFGLGCHKWTCGFCGEDHYA